MKDILVRNNVTILGEGKQTLVFGHGFGCSQKIWKDMVPYFLKNFRVILFDYVGSGQSDSFAYDRERYRTLHGYSQDLSEILEVLNTDSIIFVGHSVSSMIGLLTSIAKPELFKALIMIGPSARYMNDLPEYYGGFNERDIRALLKIMERNFIGWASANAADLMNAPEQPNLAKKLEETFHAEDPIIMRNFAEATFLSDHRVDLVKVTVPSLIIQCSEDSIVPIEAAHYINERIKDSVLKVMEVKGHYPQLSLPKETSMVILDYIERILV